MASNFDKLTEGARNSLLLARVEANRLGQIHVCAEHLLLGLLRMGDDVASHTLSMADVRISEVRDAMAFIGSQAGDMHVDESGMTPSAKRVLVLAMEEARRLDHSYIGTEHLLLGLIREGQGSCGGVFTALGVNVEMLRDQALTFTEARAAGDAPSTVAQRNHTRRHSSKLRELRTALGSAREAGDETEIHAIENAIANRELLWLDAERTRLVNRHVNLERRRLEGEEEIRRVLDRIDWVCDQRKRLIGKRTTVSPDPGGVQKPASELKGDESEDRR